MMVAQDMAYYVTYEGLITCCYKMNANIMISNQLPRIMVLYIIKPQIEMLQSDWIIKSAIIFIFNGIIAFLGASALKMCIAMHIYLCSN